MIALLFAAALFVPGADDPVCEPWQSVEVDHCAQGQLPEETIGREVGDGPFPSAALEEPAAVDVGPAAVPTPTAPPVELAATGVPYLPYTLLACGFVSIGTLATRLSARSASRCPGV